ncbi:hypothetical protein EOM71_03545, partial [Candidatus Falkowbacteria bacterium]|nr:hypothetical protein [Candidatus Falkowbacteria bacterium]
MAIFLANSFIVLAADQLKCKAGLKCIFNESGGLLFQSSNGDVDMLASNSKNYVYINRNSANNTYGLALGVSGKIYTGSIDEPYQVVVADGTSYNINIDGGAAKLNGIIRDQQPAESVGGNYYYAGYSENAEYLGFSNALARGLWSINESADKSGAISSQLAFVRSDDKGNISESMRYRFNDLQNSSAWGQWKEVCDSSNNCRNIISVLDNANDNELVYYQDPDLLLSSGIKIDSQQSLVSCACLATSEDGTLICSDCSSATSGGITGTGTDKYLSKWTTTSNLADSIIYEDNLKIGINTTSLTHTLNVNGDARFNSVSLGNQPSDNSHAINLGYLNTVLSDLSDNPAVNIKWSQLTNFPTACPAGSFVAGVSSSSLSCLTPTASATTSELWKLSGTNLYASSTDWSIGIGLASPQARLHVN